MSKHGKMRRAVAKVALEARKQSVYRFVNNKNVPAVGGPLIVSAFIKEGFGIGRAGQLTLAGLRAAGLNPIAHDIREHLSGRAYRSKRFFPHQAGGVWLIHCNPVEAIVMASRFKPKDWRDRYRIGYWAYELPIAPPEWMRMANFFHEIWTPSRFVQHIFRDLKIPVRHVPHFQQEDRASINRKEARRKIDVSPSKFVVGAAADLRSSAIRKNILGAIDIYKQTFIETEGTMLIVKVSSSDDDQGMMENIVQACSHRRDIRIIDQNYSTEEMSDLIVALDVFLSPHRSEGYGLVLTECLKSGVPVLATAWSGNVDFLSGIDPFLLDFTLGDVNDASQVYNAQKGDVWAEPNVSDAVHKLRRLYENPQIVKANLERAQSRIFAANQAWSNSMLAKQTWYSLVGK